MNYFKRLYNAFVLTKNIGRLQQGFVIYGTTVKTKDRTTTTPYLTISSPVITEDFKIPTNIIVELDDITIILHLTPLLPK